MRFITFCRALLLHLRYCITSSDNPVSVLGVLSSCVCCELLQYCLPAKCFYFNKRQNGITKSSETKTAPHTSLTINACLTFCLGSSQCLSTTKIAMFTILTLKQETDICARVIFSSCITIKIRYIFTYKYTFLQYTCI